jgi:CBS domain containing-hemolysin-like protein
VTVVDIALVIAIVALLGVAGWLSAVETVLQRVDLVRALALDDDDHDAGDLVWVLEHRGTSLNVTLMATVTVRVTTAALATVLAARWLSGAVGVVVAVVVVVAVSLVVAEVAPRSATMRRLDRSSLQLATSWRMVVRVLGPAARVFVGLGQTVARTRSESSGPFPSDEPLAPSTPDDPDADDEIEDEERAMIRSIFELGDTIAREIMVPRPDMVTVDRTAPLRDLVNSVVEHGISRIPVFEHDREHIIGVVYAKDVLRRLALQPDRTSWRDLVRDATFIPETKRVDELLRELQDQSVHIAFVVDEYGATTGLVTIEDILEEIVGEIVDEHDREDPMVEQLGDHRMRIDARLAVDDLNDLLGLRLPDDDWDTVGGLVVGALGRVPTAGEVVELDGVRFEAESVQGRRVAKVVVSSPGRRATP